MPATELSTLSLPDWAVPTSPRRDTVDAHAIRIRHRWWQDAVTARKLPGPAPTAPTLTRADVWKSDGDVFALLWRTLAWGSGSHLRQNSQRLNSIQKDVPRAEDLLTRAAEESRRDPERAYAILRPEKRNLITGLGPSFFTKFLYFAGGGAPDHPCLILDRVVATALREHCGWDSLHRAGPWPADSYGRYCGLLARWAEEHGCAPDELERSLFAGERRVAR
ncbi:8-oxoguanine DNA glycosylase OGG fold protein [Amycolatopsis pittospori]|uniref:8-oxoguanine DNA glycosylase OGG fold protein n=1 Tax=Amycolatopsis pittospori TaxID=2749434 RepID=UPI0015F0106F|nr:hypothetical protein [Amycolatopsis pittospori]